jgi:hypothetical protein
MYSLDYRTLARVLQQLGSSGEFHADVPSQTALRGGGKAILFVQSGKVISCLILNKNGQRLHHDNEAQRLLLTFGTLNWILVPSTSSKTASTVTPPSIPRAKPAENNGNTISRRLMVPEARLRAWSTLERSVYFLADGTHSIEQIATLLSRPVTTIEQVIHDLGVAGVIVQS